MRDGYGGVENAHKIPVMPKGVKLEHTGVTHKDMDFGDLAETTRDRILAGFRVSKTILGTAESDTNRATAETADYVFSKRTIKPRVELFISFLNAALTPR
jgi:capsid portal protein